MNRARKQASRALTDASREVNRASYDVGEFLERTGRNIQNGTFW